MDRWYPLNCYDYLTTRGTKNITKDRCKDLYWFIRLFLISYFRYNIKSSQVGSTKQRFLSRCDFLVEPVPWTTWPGSAFITSWQYTQLIWLFMSNSWRWRKIYWSCLLAITSCREFVLLLVCNVKEICLVMFSEVWLELFVKVWLAEFFFSKNKSPSAVAFPARANSTWEHSKETLPELLVLKISWSENIWIICKGR